MNPEEDYAVSGRDFYIGKTYSSYFAVALYGDDGIIKATCRNFRVVLDEMNEDRRKKSVSTYEENHQADILSIVGMTSALSEFSKESLGGGLKSFETENGYKIYAERLSIEDHEYTLLFIPTKEGKHAFLESFIESGLRNGLRKIRDKTVREFINIFVGDVDGLFENEFSNLSLISQRLEAEKKVTHGGKPALLYAPSGVRYGYNLSREGPAFQSELETIAKMCKAIRSSPIEVRYGKRKLHFEDLGDCYLVTIL
ncbi:MAG: hypothetical protein ACXADX_10895 [Candidatus Hodarchaeales archaeon]|jgi:hypothetical protein